MRTTGAAPTPSRCTLARRRQRVTAARTELAGFAQAVASPCELRHVDRPPRRNRVLPKMAAGPAGALLTFQRVAAGRRRRDPAFPAASSLRTAASVFPGKRSVGPMADFDDGTVEQLRFVRRIALHLLLAPSSLPPWKITPYRVPANLDSASFPPRSPVPVVIPLMRNCC